MRRLSLLLLFTAACGNDSAVIDAPATHDATHHDDAAIDAAGSGSDVASLMEPSPRDHNLELIVAAAGIVVALAPARSRRRRSKPDVL